MTNLTPGEIIRALLEAIDESGHPGASDRLTNATSQAAAYLRSISPELSRIAKLRELEALAQKAQRATQEAACTAELALRALEAAKDAAATIPQLQVSATFAVETARTRETEAQIAWAEVRKAAQ